MDDSCAVCADVLEWVAYGPCGHREVCSTCVARLRFICEDHTCCICKTHSDVVFVTKALGDYTRMINEFSVLPKVREGRVGSYWYHEDTQAFFDDIDHYKMIKAMCRLSCSVCDKMEGQPHNGSKHRANFRNIEQLKGHLFHQHKLLMCSLCLEGRKVFICEQKLYTRAELKQHISTGASEVDGTESERGGFTGHPLCEFCRTPFYGENELYSHMSTEHYTCHICQRQHPGHYEYYKNYDDLEIHFRRDHFLCEDDACLTKKFIVFPSEEALKRHNALEHGGRMSRSKRNAALQIPTSFQYRRSNEQDRRHGRGRAFQINSESQLSMAIEASLETANADHMFHDPPSTSSLQVDPDAEGTSDIDPIIQRFESLATTDSELPSRYLQALGRSRNAPLEESSFPPLPMAPKNSQQKPKQESENFPSNSMAAHLRRQRNVTDLNSAQAWSAASCGPRPLAADSTQPRTKTNSAPVKSHSSGQSKIATGNGLASSSYASLAEAWPTPVLLPVGTSRYSGNTDRIRRSASAPDLVESESVKPSISDFPPVSVAQLHKLPRSSQASLNVQDVQTANRSLVEKVRAALEFNEDRYTAFKGISGQYRQGLIDTGRYLDFVQKFGLSHLILELARLCPDEQKQQELVETYNASLQNNVPQANGRGTGNSHLKDSNGSKKGKGKSIVAEGSSSKDRLANNILSTVKQLQSAYKPLEEAAAEVLSRDGYRDSKGGKSKVLMDEHRVELITGNQPLMKLRGQNDSPLAGSISNQNIRGGGGGSKQRKKTAKFLRARLGDGSVSSLLDHKNKDPDSNPEAMDESSDGGGLPVRGVWRRGGGHKLFT